MFRKRNIVIIVSVLLLLCILIGGYYWYTFPRILFNAKFHSGGNVVILYRHAKGILGLAGIGGLDYKIESSDKTISGSLTDDNYDLEIDVILEGREIDDNTLEIREQSKKCSWHINKDGTVIEIDK